MTAPNAFPTNPLNSLRAILVCASVCAAGPLFAASGQFTFVTGDVRVVTADDRTLQAVRGLELNPGDFVVTGRDGLAQLEMVDAARLSLRPNTRLRIDSYASKPDGAEAAVLSLVQGTLRAFTGLLSARSRERFSMKTTVATIGIRGSGNILFHCAKECPNQPGEIALPDESTLNHTLEGSHGVATIGLEGAPLITGPGQTVLVNAGRPPRMVVPPKFLLSAGYVMTGNRSRSAARTAESDAMSDSRNFAAADASAFIGYFPARPTGDNGLGYTFVDGGSGFPGLDPLGLRDIVLASGAALASQATSGDLVLEGASLRAFTSYPGQQSGLDVAIAGGTPRDVQTVSAGGTTVTLGRWENGDLAVQGTQNGANGSVHWAYARSGYPSYLSEVLTGTAIYTLSAATAPTNQSNLAGTLDSATLNVNFSNRTLNAVLAVTLPSTTGGTWNLTASNVPFSQNSFFATTADRLLITSASGVTSRSNRALYGGIEGSFVGASLSAAILGYGFTDQTSPDARLFNTVSGVAVLTGTAQDSAAPFRQGLVSDTGGALAGTAFLRNFSTANRPAEVTQADNGAISSFAAPYVLAGGFTGHAIYRQGSASVADAGSNPATGLSWGRWSGGTASVSADGTGTPQSISLANSSLHYLFASAQVGPVTLPLTGRAAYDVVGWTRPTDDAGHVGVLNNATLNANFTNRTVDLGVNFSINGQAWNASANGVPIYRDQLFSAFGGTPNPVVPHPALLNIGCTPSCGLGATGAIDGFFTGRTGQGAGMMYNVGGNRGAVALARRGG